MRTAIVILAFILAGLLSGCAANPPINQAQPMVPPPPAVNYARPQPTSASLFQSARADYTSDLRARHVGDIITVEIVENSKAKKKNDTKAERTNNWKTGVNAFFGKEKDIGADEGEAKIDVDFDSKHDAKAELKREDTMTASIGCTVLEVYPNGNLLLRGSREIEVNGETQYIILQGTARPADVTTYNTIQSTQLADAKVSYTGRGVLTDKQQPGWLIRLLDHVWPI